MGGTLFRALRGGDGRSFGRALAILYLVAAVIAAFGNGASAAMTMSGPVLCIAGADGKVPAQTPGSGTHTAECCLTGHAPTPVATPAAPAELRAPLAVATGTPAETSFLLSGRRLTGAGSPRGPPLDA